MSSLNPYGFGPEYRKFVTEISYALADDKGRNRTERHGSAYYKLVRKTPGAVFVKLCDRIANVEFGKLMGGNMFNTYKEEQKHLKYELYTDEYKEMWDYLESLLNN